MGQRYSCLCGFNDIRRTGDQLFGQLFRDFDEAKIELNNMFSQFQKCKVCDDFLSEIFFISQSEKNTFLILINPLFTFDDEINEINSKRYTNKIVVNDPNKIIIPSENDSKIEYRIVSFIEHSGDSIVSGHYVAWVRNVRNKNKWVRIEDSKIGFKEEFICLDNAYLIFLQKN